MHQTGKENEVSGSRTEDVKVYTDLLHDKLSKVLGIPKETLDKSLTVKETNEVKYADDGLNQSAISKKTSKKAREVLNAIQKISDGSEEETVKNLRDDLEQYGGTNDVTFVFGNDKKGIQHIAQKHGAKTLLKVFDTVIDGDVIRYVKGNNTVILGKNNYEAVLSLEEYGNKKTWLLSGWDVNNKKSSDVGGEVSTQSATTQIKPTFSRQDLGAELSNIITNYKQNFNSNILNQTAYTGSTADYDLPSLDFIGTGEGAQAHGWGLYYAKGKNVAEKYREKLTTTGLRKDIDNVEIGGKTIEDAHKSTLAIGVKNTNKQNVIDRIKRDLKNYKRHQIEADTKADEEAYQPIIDSLNDDLEFVKNLDENSIKINYANGQLYEVDIPESDVLLDEDKLLKEQPEKVKKL